MRRRLDTTLKIAVTIAGMAVVLWQVEPEAVARTLLNVQPAWLLLSVLLINIGLFVRAARWLILLRSLQMKLSFWRLLALYYAGNFFNTFLPTSIGGDVIRVVEVARSMPGGVAAGAVVVDRLTGLLMLFLLALIALPFRPPTFPESLVPLIGGISFAGLVGGALLLEGTIVRILIRRLTRLFRHPLRRRLRLRRLLRPLAPTGDTAIARFLNALEALQPHAIAGALATSLLFNLVLTLWWWAAARSLGFSIPFVYLLLVIPILSISTLVPSIGGLGVREAVAAPLFAALGGVAGAAIAAEAIGPTLSLLVFLLERLVGFVGAPVYLWLLRREEVDGASS